MLKHKTKSENLDMLDKIIKKGKMSNELYEAVQSINEAVKQDNILLVCELSSVKSLISGKIKTQVKEYPYRENDDFNKKVLGDSIYSLIGTLHFEYTMKTDRMPSGMILITSNGKQEADKTNYSNHPIVKKINAEFDRTWSETFKKCK